MAKQKGIKIVKCRTPPSWKPDPKGYFIIKVFRDSNEIGIRHYNYKDQSTAEFKGKKATHIYNEIIKRRLISKLDHAAYIGKELMKAEHALKNKKRYVQN